MLYVIITLLLMYIHVLYCALYCMYVHVLYCALYCRSTGGEVYMGFAGRAGTVHMRIVYTHMRM